MSPEEQAERDRIALALDALIGFTAMVVGLDQEPPADTLSTRLAARVDQGWLEFWRRHSVA